MFSGLNQPVSASFASAILALVPAEVLGLELAEPARPAHRNRMKHDRKKGGRQRFIDSRQSEPWLR